MRPCRVALSIALSCVLNAILSPLLVRAADYSTPDYRPSANVTPYTTSGPITIQYSVSNLSDVAAPPTTIEFAVASASNPTHRTVLGTVPVASLSRWSSAGKTVSYPVPGTLPAGYTAMRLTTRVVPTSGEVKTANNTVTTSFAVQLASAPSQPTVTPSQPTTSLSQPTSTTLEGFGATTRGGAGHPVYTVTSLAASGPGTLAEAVSRGNRYVKFAVAGTIHLTDGIWVTGAFLTIDGASAPSPGITLRGGGLYMHGNKGAHDIIVRHLRVRGAVNDAFRVAYGGYNIVLDHVSAHGSRDGDIDITENSHDVTVAWSIFADPASQHNSLIAYRPWRITMHHNLFIASTDRNPSIAYDYAGTPANGITLDFRNNLVWDWGGGVGSRVQSGSKANIVNNYYHAQLGDNEDALVVCRASGMPAANQGDCNHGDPTRLARAFVAGNVNPGLTGRNINAVGTESSPFPAASVTLDTACRAAEKVRAQAGALPRDAVDATYVSTISLRTDLCR